MAQDAAGVVPMKLGTWDRGRGTLLAVIAALATASSGLSQNPPPGPGAQPAPAAATPQRGGVGRRGISVMTLTSSAFPDGGMIPAKHAQPGRDVSPPLAWTGAPDSVASFVLIVHDADAATGNGLDDALQWMVWTIPGSTTSLPEGIQQGPLVTLPSAGGGDGGGARVRQMSVSGPYYRGPAAPSTGPPHHYVFELYALDVTVNVQPVGQTPAATRAAVLDAMKDHVRGKGVLVGLFRRAEPPIP